MYVCKCLRVYACIHRFKVLRTKNSPSKNETLCGGKEGRARLKYLRHVIT